MLDDILKSTREEMDKAIDALKKQLATIRTGRANPAMLDGVRVDYYGAATPLNQLATVSAQDARMLVIKPFDKKALKDIERAIVEANLGFNPTNDGDFIRCVMPPLSGDRRKEYVKMSKGKGEDAKVAIRNHRRAANEQAKEATDEGLMTQDDETKGKEKIQALTDQYIKNIDDLIAKKEKEIMEV